MAEENKPEEKKPDQKIRDLETEKDIKGGGGFKPSGGTTEAGKGPAPAGGTPQQ
jgi:hypothetical protein